MKIEADSQVTLHFDVRLKDGSVADSTREIGEPFTFQMGRGVFSDKFESALVGMSQGDKKKIMLLPQDAFGEPHPANVFQVPMSKFKGSPVENDLEPGVILQFTQMNGQDMPGLVREVGEEEVTVDFNHPLAGHVVLFDVEILGVQTCQSEA